MKQKFKSCMNCGKYFEIDPSNKEQLFCSSSCAEIYVSCETCGKYFVRDPLSNEEGNYCSDECKKKYHFDKKKELLILVE